MSMHPLHILLLCTFLSQGVGAYAQTAQTPVQWLSWGEGMAKASRENKKILLYVYTGTCGWCKKMEGETFSHGAVGQLVNASFVPVKLNAAENADLEFKGKTYRFVNSGPRGYNALAAEILEGRMSFPSVVFLDEAQQTLQSIAGFKTVEEFLPMATYYGKDYYKNIPWSTFQKKYASGQ